MKYPTKTAIVTGGGSGIGLATARKLAAACYSVRALDLEYSVSSIQELRAAGVQCLTGDVNDSVAVAQLVDGIDSVDVLVNSAGVWLVKQIEDVSEEEWDHVLNTNLKAAFFLSKLVIPIMKQQDAGGCIVNIASNAGLLPRSHDPVYSISKMALVGLTKSLALCHSKHRIRVNCICPGPVSDTKLIEENFAGRTDAQQVVRELIQASPLARAWDRMITPDEVADSVLYLCSDAARMISGTAIAIDGGKSLGVPPCAD